MKKKILSIICVAILAFATFSIVSAEETDQVESTEGSNDLNEKDEKVPIDGFRGFKWGTSKDEIISKDITDDMIEGEDYGIIGDGDTLAIIYGDVAGYDAFVYYGFDEKQELISGRYVLTEEHTNLNDYYSDFRNILSKYEKRYGEADWYKEEWKDDFYKGNDNKIGMAIATGDLYITAMWLDESGSNIIFIITGDNYEIKTSIGYFSPEYEEEENTDGV